MRFEYTRFSPPRCSVQPVHAAEGPMRTHHLPAALPTLVPVVCRYSSRRIGTVGAGAPLIVWLQRGRQHLPAAGRWQADLAAAFSVASAGCWLTLPRSGRRTDRDRQPFAVTGAPGYPRSFRCLTPPPRFVSMRLPLGIDAQCRGPLVAPRGSRWHELTRWLLTPARRRGIQDVDDGGYDAAGVAERSGSLPGGCRSPSQPFAPAH